MASNIPLNMNNLQIGQLDYVRLEWTWEKKQ